MKTDGYFKVRRFMGGTEAWTTAADIEPFCSRSRVSIEDAFARALRRAEVADSAIVCVSKQPTFEGEWTTCPTTTAPLPAADLSRPETWDDDCPGTTGDLFGYSRVGAA